MSKLRMPLDTAKLYVKGEECPWTSICKLSDMRFQINHKIDGEGYTVNIAESYELEFEGPTYDPAEDV